MYYDGDGVKQDDGEAFRWYQKAAEQGHEGAKKSSKSSSSDKPISHRTPVVLIALLCQLRHRGGDGQRRS